MTIKNIKTPGLAYAVVPRTISPKLALVVSIGLVMSGSASLQAAEIGGTVDATSLKQLLQKINERDQKIAERDRVIDDLQRRVLQLEQITVANLQSKGKVKPVASAAAVKTSPGGQLAAASPASKPPINQQPPVQNKTAQPTQQAKAAPGSFEVDEDAAQRALERTLVQTGALLLPLGKAEIQPFATYTRREGKQPTFLTSLVNGNPTITGVTNTSTRRNEFDMGANLLVGLPFEAQAEFRIPYRVVNQSDVVINGENSTEKDNTGSSLGDISVGLAKTLVHESDWIPDLIARLTWNSSSGSLSDNNVQLGTGFNDLRASITALKRQDPLAFTGTVAYQTTFERKGIEPGDQFSLAVGATLAASPQTSLSVGLQQTYARETKFNNVKVQGSDAVSSAFTLGASSTIGHSLFFSALGGIGLTDSSPDYFFNITVPFRFDVPYKSIGNKL